MSAVVQWHDAAQTVLRWEFEGAWTWEEFYQAQDEVNALSASVEHPVDIIVVMHPTSAVPAGAPSQFGRIARGSHGRSGRTVLVGANRFVEVMLSIFGKFQRETARRITTAKSIEEALALLARQQELSEG